MPVLLVSPIEKRMNFSQNFYVFLGAVIIIVALMSHSVKFGTLRSHLYIAGTEQLLLFIYELRIVND